MSHYTSHPTDATVRSEYAQLQELLPNIGALTKDTFGDWYIQRLLVGETCREAAATLRGIRWGLTSSVFALESAS